MGFLILFQHLTYFRTYIAYILYAYKTYILRLSPVKIEKLGILESSHNQQDTSLFFSCSWCPHWGVGVHMCEASSITSDQTSVTQELLSLYLGGTYFKCQ